MTRSSWTLAFAVFAASCARPPLPVVEPNDNRTPAGIVHADTLTLRLSVQMATWRPESDSGVALSVAAFGEDGTPPSIPAPLIRVRAGTRVVVTIRNALRDSLITVRGLGDHAGSVADSVRIAVGDSATVSFMATMPGTYLYGAQLGAHDSDKDEEREQLGGAFIVDPPEGSPPDRVFVMNIWGRAVDTTTYINALAINGKSWPYDEALNATVGDTLLWRVVNATGRQHPMHLHGFYFEVASRGSMARDTAIAPGRRPLVVTEGMAPFSTMYMRWSPNRPGRWLFHCHIGFHVTPENARPEVAPETDHSTMSGDARRHMAGLVLGITVRPAPSWKERERANPERVRLTIDSVARRGRAKMSLAFVRDGAGPQGTNPSAHGSSTLLLTRGRPTDITVVNHLKEASAVHWHGIELESYSDGVAGWSGMNAASMAPAIAPSDSFVAHLTLPRAGTFIYHTHLNDIRQMSHGLYGALLVLEPGARFDPATDHLFALGSDRDDNASHVMVNGDTVGTPVSWRAGTAHRLRFINIAMGSRYTFALRRDTTTLTWRALARDGADLPAALQVDTPSSVRMSVGETRDYTWRPAPGEYQLVIIGKVAKAPIFVQRITVK